jgi:hypothetical protein
MLNFVALVLIQDVMHQQFSDLDSRKTQREATSLVIRRRRVWEAWPVRSLFKLDRQSRPLPRPRTSRVEP